MSRRLRGAALLAGVGAGSAIAEVVWVVAFLGRSSDGPAFLMALVAVVVVPTLLAATGACLAGGAPARSLVAATAAVGFAGLTAAGVEAGVFVGDDPLDPAFIHWTAAAPPLALPVAVLLTGVAVWGPLGRMSPFARIAVTAVVASVVPVGLALVLLMSTPLVLLAAVAAPAVLLVVGRRRRRPAAL